MHATVEPTEKMHSRNTGRFANVPLTPSEETNHSRKQLSLARREFNREPATQEFET